MCPAVDFERSFIDGDYCFYLTRTAGHTALLRQPLHGGAPDPLCQKEAVPEEEVPAHLRAPLQVLRRGGVPPVG